MATFTSQKSSSSSGTLQPGFRFHPTDEELVSYYLKRKICGKRFRLDAIADVDVYKVEPWDLPGKSKLKSRDLELYFFSGLDKKYGNGARTNRATEKGYWKTTGKDRAVYRNSSVVGMKKTLVYHDGRAPRGQRTNWVMHEYKLMDEGLAKAGINPDAYVLCRIFQKSGPGPKNGERHRAPLVEEEWEEDELDLTPVQEVVEEVVVSDDNDIYLDSSDLQQIFDSKIPGEDIPLQVDFNHGGNSDQVHDTPVEENYHAQEQEPENKHSSSSIQMQNQLGVEQANQGSANDLDFLLDEPFFDALGNGSFDDVAFFETDDLLGAAKVNNSGVDMPGEYLDFVNPNQDNNSHYTAFDSYNMMGNENLFADQSFFTPEFVNEEAKQENIGYQQLLQGSDDDAALVSKQKYVNVQSGGQYSFVQKASDMLGDVSAPPALASEFPTKEMTLRLTSLSTSSSVHLTAGMNVSFVVSFGLSRNNGENSLSFEPSFTDVLSKATSAISRSMMYLMFFGFPLLAVTYKFGSCFCSSNVSS